MKASREYLDAPNPVPPTKTMMMWALSDQRGRFATTVTSGELRLYTRKPEGYFQAGCFGKYRNGPVIWKPRRVKVTVKALGGTTRKRQKSKPKGRVAKPS